MAVDPLPEGRQRPIQGPDYLERPRLIRALDDSRAGTILLSAPAGYGKTSLAAEWLEGRQSAWFTASAACADLHAFAVGVARTAATILPGAGAGLLEAAAMTSMRAAEVLGADLAAWPDHAWLVIDDYHLAATSEVEEFVGTLIDVAPVRLLVGTRRRPSWATARRALYGQVTELGTSELALTTEEVVLLLGSDASEGGQALVDRAEGWPALVSLARKFSSGAASDARLGDHLYSFLAEEVFGADASGTSHLVLAAALLTSVADRPSAGTNGARLANRHLPQLTPRENDVLELMSDGLRNSEIADKLFISEKTAKVHVSHIFEKLGVVTRVQAVLASKRVLGVNGGLSLEH